MVTHESRLFRLLVAVAATLGAVLMRLATGDAVGAHGPWLWSTLAVVISAWFGGLKPGMVTAAPLMAIGYYLETARAAATPGPADAMGSPALSALVFGLTCFVICAAMQSLRMARFGSLHAENRLHKVLESTQDAILAIDGDFCCLYANARAGQIAKKEPAMLFGKSLRTVFPETPAVTIYKELQRTLRERAPVHFEDQVCSGGAEATNRWYEFNAYPSAAGLTLFIRDITERKVADRERKASEGDHLRLEYVLRELPVGVIIASQAMRLELVNQAASDLFGACVAPGRDLSQMKRGARKTLSGEVVDPHYSPLRQTLLTRERLVNVDVEYEHPDGGNMTLLVNCVPLLRPDGGMRGALCTWADVTSIRKMQKALASSETRLRRLFDSPIIGVISGDEASILEANQAFLTMLGYSAEDLANGGVKWSEITPPEYLHLDARAIMQLSATGFAEQFEKEYIAKDGRRVPVLIGAAACAGDDWAPWIAWVLDRSEHLKMEGRLRDAAKLESIGLLAGGIAHDFNNILTSILGNTSLAREALAPDHAAHGLLESAIHATERAADLTRQLLDYAGKGSVVVRPLNLSVLAREISQLIRTSVPRHVEMELRLAPDLPPVEGDATQLLQLIMNLVINGAEAVGEAPGKVSVVVECMHAEAAWLHGAGLDGDLSPGEYVSLEVRDTGCGMDQATQERIFDPFFTTKFTGRGLGLAAAQGIVRGHKGGIRVKSTPGNGSLMQVLLPVSRNTVVVVKDTGQTVVARGTGTVLVVDDEESVREVTRASLERYGYTVLVAAGGKDAIEIYRGLFYSISMVMLDLTMPAMSGEVTMGNLMAINPRAKILLTSGFDDPEPSGGFAGRGPAGFIQKPYSAAALAVKVREILDGPAA